MLRNMSLAVFLLDKSAIAVRAAYKLDVAGKPEDVKLFKTFDKTIKEGDLVVVETGETHRFGMTVCKVTAINVDVDFDSTDVARWIVGTIDRADFDSLVAKETRAQDIVRSAEKRKRQEELREAILKDVSAQEKEQLLIGTAAEPPAI